MGRKRKPITLGVDLGGTKVEVAVVDVALNVLAETKEPKTACPVMSRAPVVVVAFPTPKPPVM